MSQHRDLELFPPVNAIDHLLGPEHAPVTLVEYGDFECPNCKQAAPAVKLALEQFPARVHAVFRHFPLEEVHPHALIAAQAAECAGAQNKFWEMHDLLFDHQSHLTRDDLRKYADRLQLDLVRFDAELGDEIYLQRVREHIESGKRSGVRGTPAFYLNGQFVDVSFGLQALSAGIKAILENS
ncbi:MAG: DsbA family protein [Verrucomicrobiaceae bacterium]|nr:DsbA family protein [Verrucomicrobiaceae bacterium]